MDHIQHEIQQHRIDMRMLLSKQLPMNVNLA